MSARWVDSLLEWICLPFCRSVRHLHHANRLEFLPYRMIIGIYCREWVLGSWPSASEFVELYHLDLQLCVSLIHEVTFQVKLS